jgi:hypothetical protein
VLAAVLITPLVPANIAAAASDTKGIRTTIEVVADGLDTPRGLIYDRKHRRVLVAEAGTGGTAPCGQANGNVTYCYGPTGSVFQFSERGHSSRRIITGLPSIKAEDGSAVLGLHDLGLNDDRLTLLFGLSGKKFFRDQLGPGAIALAQTARVDRHGNLVPLADLVTFEEQNNPHPAIIDSDPYGIAVGRFGTVVADAAGNDILLIKRDGTISVLAVFPTRVPAANPADTVESVPTTVVKGPDGAFYVGELSGFPYYKGEARVYRLVPGQAPTIFAQGFTNIADLTFDERGRLIVLEMAKEGLFLPADTVTGRLVRVERNGTQTDLATTGLENPGGVAYVGNGVFYITNRTTSTGDVGQLLKVKVRG